ncbi:hypothetical protein Mapa_011678 [Marchantia paleacea]|nr:hypothetical protein Mapa_011678 [Marchantia paleacea]
MLLDKYGTKEHSSFHRKVRSKHSHSSSKNLYTIPYIPLREIVQTGIAVQIRHMQLLNPTTASSHNQFHHAIDNFTSSGRNAPVFEIDDLPAGRIQRSLSPSFTNLRYSLQKFPRRQPPDHFDESLRQHLHPPDVHLLIIGVGKLILLLLHSPVH